MTLSRKDLTSIICIACGKRYGEHTKGNGTKFNLPSLMTCMFRIQGTVVADGINDAPVSSLNNDTKHDDNFTFDKDGYCQNTKSPPVEELEYDC
jgi:hypothetical protein